MTVNLGQVTGPSTALAFPTPAPALTLSDLSFLTCIERTELGESWKVRTPAGKQHLCQFLPPTDPGLTDELLGKLQSYRHRALVPSVALRGDQNRLALLSILEGPTLADRFQQLWAAKQPGIPRDELLGYLRSLAIALDLLYARHQAQHLWLHPRHLVIHEDRVQILAFGLVETWWAQTRRPTAELNPRFSAPELARTLGAPCCDQYSLALIFSELLTGTNPWRGRPSAGQRAPDLGLLPGKDRMVIERALNLDPSKRFPTITAMVEALERSKKIILPPPPIRPWSSEAGAALSHNPQAFPSGTLEQFVRELVSLVAGKAEPQEELKIRFTLEPSRRLESAKFLGQGENHLPLFDDFCRQWHAKTIQRKDGLVILAINAPPTIWQWLSGRRFGLEIRVEFLPSTWINQRPHVSVSIKPFGCEEMMAAKMLKELGPTLLEKLRVYLHGRPDQRGRNRVAVRQRVRICPIVNGTAIEPLECITKDISAGGIGFFSPVELPASEVYVNLPDLSNLASYAALAQVARKQPAKDGWFEVGAAFPLGQSE